jgi:hypothetical protein
MGAGCAAMSQPGVERTLGKLLTDEAFRERFLAAPELASWEPGLQLSAVELEALSRSRGLVPSESPHSSTSVFAVFPSNTGVASTPRSFPPADTEPNTEHGNARMAKGSLNHARCSRCGGCRSARVQPCGSPRRSARRAPETGLLPKVGSASLSPSFLLDALPVDRSRGPTGSDRHRRAGVDQTGPDRQGARSWCRAAVGRDRNPPLGCRFEAAPFDSLMKGAMPPGIRLG